MADHPNCYSKTTQQVTTREAKISNQPSAPSSEDNIPPICSKRPVKKSVKEGQGGSQDPPADSKASSLKKLHQNCKQVPSSGSPARKKSKAGLSQRNLSPTSSQSALAPSSTNSSHQEPPSPSDKRSTLRSNPRAALLEGLNFSGRRRSSSSKGKVPASKGKVPANKGKVPANKLQPPPATPSTSQRSSRKRVRSGATSNQDQPKAGSSTPFKIRLPPLPLPESDAPGEPGPSRTSRVAAKCPAETSKPKAGKSRERSKSHNKSEQARPTRSKRKRSTNNRTAQDVSENVEEVVEKKKKAKSTNAPQKKSNRKPSGSSQLNTGSCASTRRRAASKEGGRLRTSNSSALTPGGPASIADNTQPVAPNSAMSGNDNRHFGNPGSIGESAEASGSMSDQAEAGTSSGTTGSSSFATSLGFDQESDVGRLQALLEARGVPSHLFGTLGPRMHQILQRTVLGSSVYKVQVILQNLQSKDENQQLSAAIEMCQLLVMGNEDTLAGFPTRQVVPALIGLLKSSPMDEMGTNFDVMHHACRALTYMMEALPRSSSVVVDAVPVFLEKLQSIQCMDVAEQALQALEMLSKKHHKAILHANGVSSCLMFLDFFSLPAQRTALSITANCCQNLTVDEFNFVRSSLPTLANLLTQQDKKLLESVCLSMSRLVENFHCDESILREVAGDGSLHNMIGLLTGTPPLISSAMFVTVVHMLASMCSTCPDLAVQLLNFKIADTLCGLLVAMNQGASVNFELTPRTPQELYEIVCLVGELMPKLPADGIFSIDQILKKSSGASVDGVSWQWLDDLGAWHQYSTVDCRIIETALQSGEREVNLCIFGVNYTIDFESLQQINEDTGTTRHVKRKVHTPPTSSSQQVSLSPPKVDARGEALKDTPELGDSFIKTLFCVLYEVYNSSAGTSIRHKCLQALMRIIYYGNAEPLKSVLPTCNVSSHIAAMMASTDLKVVVVSIQMATVLMEKLPEVFNIHFCREGVMHQIKKLREPPAPSPTSNPPERQNQPPNTKVMDLSTSTLAACQQQQQSHPIIVAAPGNSNHNNGGLVAVAGSSRSTRSSGFPHQPFLGSLMPPPQGSTFRQLPFMHMPPHLPTSFNLPPPPPPYPSFHVFQEPTIEFPPPPPLPPNHPFLPGQIGGLVDGVGGSLALGSTGRSSPVSPRLNKINNALKHKKATSRRLSGGKPGRGGAFGGLNPPMLPASPATPGVGLVVGSNSHQQQQQVLQMPSYYTQLQQHQQTSELHGLLGDPEHSAHMRASRWNNPKSSNFFGGLKWNRSGANRQLERPASPLPTGTMAASTAQLVSHQQLLFQTPVFAVPNSNTGTPASATASDTKERVRMWICEQAVKFCKKYYGHQNPNSPAMSALSSLNQLCAANNLLQDESKGLEGLHELSKIMVEEDVSPFEMIHSGILDSLLAYLMPTSRPCKSGKASTSDSKVSEADMSLRYDRAKTFLTVFLKSPKVAEERVIFDVDVMDTRPLQSIVSKLMACFHHLEQFQVKVHDLPAGSSSSRGGNNAIRFFDTHQIKCNLQRHPTCSTLRQWKGGPVKIDPLALVQAIERYLLLRGFAKIRQGGEEDDDDEDEDASEDEDIEEGLSVPSTSHHRSGGSSRRHQHPQHHHQQQQQSNQQHSIEFVLNDHVLPYNMTVYEAVRQFGSHSAGRSGGVTGQESEAETDWEGTFGANCIWTNTHTIYYRPVSEGCSSLSKSSLSPVADIATSPKKTKTDKSKSKGSMKTIKDLDLGRCSSLDQALDLQLLSALTFKDPSLKVLPLLTILHALSRHWGVLFEKLNSPPLLSNQEFLSSKLTSKANRQLQDPLSIMTGNIPSWLGQIARTCSFLLPFETRQLLFYATAFDRDRAMLRVQRESNQDQGSSSENNDRVVPRLERRKATISREDILKQAEKLIGDMSNYKALLEIQYENEVGTGLGPTMEFYALVSRELQRHDLDLWSGDPISGPEDLKKDNQQKNQYTFSSCGLFPLPIPKSTRAAQVNRVKAKFKFLGKFMGKALMDSRMLDISLSKAVYKWILASNNSQQNLRLSDLQNVLPLVSKFVQQLLDILKQKKKIESDASHTTESRNLALNSLTIDGCSFDDLGVDFCFPGFPHIEMKKGGKDTMLSLHNIEEYLKLLVHWSLYEGPGRQLEALKEGFESIFPLSLLSLFYPEEMEMLFCGNNFESWTLKYLGECCRVDHGYTSDSRPIKFFFEVLSTFTSEQQRLFIQFTTGSPRLPVGGLKSLNPPLTIVRKAVENNDNPDNYLPSVMTCVNYFKLPEYSSLEITREKLLMATKEGQKSFHLS